MRILKLVIKTAYLVLLLCLPAILMTGSSLPASNSSAFSVDEDIYVTASITVPPNTVDVTITRSGPDAGLYSGCVVYVIRYNEGFGSSYEKDITYREPVDTQTFYNVTVAGAIPSLSADVINVWIEYDNPECHEW